MALIEVTSKLLIISQKKSLVFWTNLSWALLVVNIFCAAQLNMLDCEVFSSLPVAKYVFSIVLILT